MKELKAKLPKPTKKLPKTKQECPSFECNVTVGRELLALSQYVDGWEKRDCYSQLDDYLYHGDRTRICLVYGLRRTGKTALLRQAVADMTEEDQAKSAYIKIRRSDTMAMVNRDMRSLFAAMDEELYDRAKLIHTTF